MKKLLFCMLILSACWSAPEKHTPVLKAEIDEYDCGVPMNLNAFYNETERTIEAFWEASASSVIHYMISLNGSAYQVVDFTKPANPNYPGRSYTFTDMLPEAHIICVCAVCLKDEAEGKSPFPSETVCTQLQLGTMIKEQQPIEFTDLASLSLAH